MELCFIINIKSINSKEPGCIHMSETIVSAIESHGVIAICRKVYGKDLLALAGALREGGVRLMEVTFDQSDADCLMKTGSAIRSLCEAYPDMLFGAGTVLTTGQVDAAKEAGAEFIISPNTDIDVIRHTKRLDLVSIPGAMTPTEVMTAHNAGADFVKLFPAGYLGLAYLKDLTAPVNHVKILATGGVNAANFADFLHAGCRGAGISNSLCDRKKIAAGDWEALTAAAREFTAIFEASAKEKLCQK
jgi:2-dehydro-3-deoxyphosphogluconate aldolase/(4S)-4-hydroxy-2-oxoglutarate aldolase